MFFVKILNIFIYILMFLQHDIESATNNGKKLESFKNKKLYKKDITKIKNKFKATYYFYCFPDKYSDAFGYTSKRNKHLMGDFYYKYSDL